MTKRCVNAKSCATCEFWDGQRSVDRDPKWVQVTDSLSKGMCQGNGPWRGKEMTNMTTCKAYQKWRFM